MNIVYFDVESQKLFHEVGGRDPSRLLLACGVTWSTARNDFAVYWEQDAAALIAELKSADRVIGFNIIGFDYEVLKPYARQENFRAFRSTDLLQDIYRTLGFRLSLDSIARATLGTTKIAATTRLATIAKATATRPSRDGPGGSSRTMRSDARSLLS